MLLLFVCSCQEEKDQQWKQAMDYLSAVTELNYMTQIVIMLYEDNDKVSLLTPSSRRFVVVFTVALLCVCVRVG